MSDQGREPDPNESPYGGLCAGCVHVKVVSSDRGSAFVQCRLAKADARFVRYPPQPVLVCSGFKR